MKKYERCFGSHAVRIVFFVVRGTEKKGKED